MTFQQVFLNTVNDCNWLIDAHLIRVPLLTCNFQSFVITGNEDAPERVDLYESERPLCTDPFLRIEFLPGGANVTVHLNQIKEF